MLTLSIIILSYNTKDLLRVCLNSLYKFLPKGYFEIIVVDNASADGSPEYIRKEFPGVHLVESRENLGFAAGINKGEHTAKGKFLLFLNSDAELTGDGVAKMVSFLDDAKHVAVCGGILTDPDGTLQRSSGKFYTLFPAIRMLVLGDTAELRKTDGTGPVRVDWVSGGFMLVKRDIFEKLHGFDERFFMYIEDMEFCYRVMKLGYAVYLFPEASAFHSKHGSSSRSYAVMQIYTGLLYFYQKHRSRGEYYILKVLMSLKALAVYALGFITGNEYYRKTYRDALYGILRM